MKRMLTAFLLASALALTTAGCKTATNPPQPQTLAPGFQNPADQAMDQALVGAHNFYQTIQCSTLGQGIIQATGACDPNTTVTKYTPSAAEKTALNNFSTALNSAQIIYIAYHAGQSTQAQAQAAVNSVTAQQTALQSSLSGGTK